jgi:hypothetical protein
MRKSWLMCVLMGALAWGQAAPGTPPPPAQSNQAAPAAAGDMSASVPADAAVITVNGVCPTQAKAPVAKAATGTAKPATAATKTPSADCKTVITKAEFEKLASGLSPNMTPQLRRQLATILPRLIAMSAAAKKKGLDKNPRYEETLKFAKMQILTNELQRNIQEEAAKIPPQEIADYYKKNPEAYEEYNVDRLFVPRLKQVEPEAKDNDKEEKLTEEQQKAKEEQEKAREAKSEEEMGKLAETLHGRAAAGEDFIQLQKEAFEAAGMKIESPTVNLPKVRRTGLPPGHAGVFDLKEGDVSQVISDSGGHYVYKVKTRAQIPLEQVKGEIQTALQNQRMKDAMEKYQSSFKVETNEAYFGPSGPGGMQTPLPPRGTPRPKLPPAPTSPAPQAQPPAQAPPPKPN